MSERLQKLLSRAGIASRRSAERMITEGRVRLNGEIVTELGTAADLAIDEVRVDGVPLRPPAEPVYFLLYKPRGVVSTRKDPAGRRTVMDCVPKVRGLFPVGRLDIDTEGLILLTTDGAFAERVSHPRFGVERVYRLKVRGCPDAAALIRLRRGVRSDGERLSADHVRVVEPAANAWLEIVLHSGRRHEVKRLMKAIGHPVSKLKRIAIGRVSARGMKPGNFRVLESAECRDVLRPIVRRSPRGTGKRAAPSARRPPASSAPQKKRPTTPTSAAKKTHTETGASVPRKKQTRTGASARRKKPPTSGTSARKKRAQVGASDLRKKRIQKRKRRNPSR